MGCVFGGRQAAVGEAVVWSLIDAGGASSDMVVCSSGKAVGSGEVVSGGSAVDSFMTIGGRCSDMVI